MKKAIIPLALSLVSSTAAFADHLDEVAAKKNAPVIVNHDDHSDEQHLLTEFGEFTGSLGTYYQRLDNMGADTEQDEFANGYYNVNFTSKEWNGLQLGIGYIGNAQLKDNDTYNDNIGKHGEISELWASYSLENTTLKLGRQGLEYIMLEDYFDGITLESTAIDGFEIKLAWVNRVGTLDPDDFVEFDEINPDDDGDDTDGVYGTEISYVGIDGLTLTGVYYRANDSFAQFGGQAVLETECTDNISNAFLIETYEMRNQGDSNGHLFHVNNTVSIGNVDLGIGYIETGSKAGVGGMLNNGWDPFDEDNLEELVDAKAFYGLIDYKVTESFTIGTVFGRKRYDASATERVAVNEVDLILSWDITDQLNIEAAYVHLDTENDVKEDFDKVWAHVSYSF